MSNFLRNCQVYFQTIPSYTLSATVTVTDQPHACQQLYCQYAQVPEPPWGAGVFTVPCPGCPGVLPFALTPVGLLSWGAYSTILSTFDCFAFLLQITVLIWSRHTSLSDMCQKLLFSCLLIDFPKAICRRAKYFFSIQKGKMINLVTPPNILKCSFF